MRCGSCKVKSRRGWSKADLVFLLVIVASIVAIVMVKGNRSPAPLPEVFAEKISLSEASQQSAETGKPVLVFATASWCGPCQAFKRGTLSDPAVADAIKTSAIPVYLDIDENPEAASMFGIRSIPTLLFLKNGMIVDRAGNMNSSGTIDWLAAAAEKSLKSAG